MDLSDSIQFELYLITAIGFIITAVGLVYSIYHNAKQFNELKKQIKLQIFADYTKRYQEIKFRFPSSIYDDDFDLASLPVNQQEGLRLALRAYFDLCSEEFYLKEEERIEPAIWEMWKEEIISSINRPAFGNLWIEIREEYLTYPEFVEFVDKNVKVKQNEKH